MSEEPSPLRGGPESQEAKKEFWSRMFKRLPPELQDMVWQHAAWDAGPQMLYLDIDQVRHIGYDTFYWIPGSPPCFMGSEFEYPEPSEEESVFIDHDKLG